MKKSLNNSKTRPNSTRFSLSILFFLFATSAFAGGVYNVGNLVFPEGEARPNRSGELVFSDRFENADCWNEIANYRDLLQIEIGRELNGEKTLYVSRETPLDPNDSATTDVAWSATTVRIPFPAEKRGAEFLLRVSATASKPIASGGDGNEGETWRAALRWFDESGVRCGETPLFLRAVNAGFAEKTALGRVPNEAATFEIRLGFDRPNVEFGEFVAVRSLELEILDDAPYRRPGEFVSEIFPGGVVSWDADVPDGTAVRFQVSTAPFDAQEPEIPGEFGPFVGPDGTAETFFDRPFSVDAPFLQYKAILVPNGRLAPTLRSVSIGAQRDANWFVGGDANPPRVRIVGACAAPTLDRRAPLTLEISDESAIRWSTLKIVVDGTDATDRFVRDAAPTSETPNFPKLGPQKTTLTLTPDADWPDGLRRVGVEISDVRGSAVSASKVFLIGTAPTTPRVTLRDDGATLVDGEPFFPIGIYGVMKREFNGFDFDAAFSGLRDAGFNFAHSYAAPRTDEFLAAAEKYGFKLWIVAHEIDDRFLEIERRHPAILAWYLGDDTSYNTTPSELFDRRDAVKGLDPTRLTVQADPVDSGREISNYFPYVAGTDAFLPEIYPIRDDGPDSGFNCVAQTIRDVDRCRADARAVGDGPKAIWPIIQYFQGWGWKRFPTFDELNAMSFAALIRGANGITWYTYGGTVEPENNKYNYGVASSPERWKNISIVATRIRSLAPVLLERTNSDEQPRSVVVLEGPKTDPFGAPAVSCLLKKHDGATYLLAVDANPEPVRVRFELDASSSEKNEKKDVEILFENRSTTLENGVLIDDFEGFGVRVYRWR